jgi:hypothetical protein
MAVVAIWLCVAVGAVAGGLTNAAATLGLLHACHRWYNRGVIRR